MLAVPLWGLAALMVPSAGNLQRAARILVSIAVVSVVIAMALALEYAGGPLLGLGVLSVSRMAQIHGTANAVGFTGCAMLAFTLPSLARSSRSAGP